MAKFISKNSNLHIILRPGMQSQPLTGTPAVPSISVRFQDGMADVADENLVKMMLAHPGFNTDYIAADELTIDPYAHLREESEPVHTTTEMKYGHPVNRSVSAVKTTLPPEIKKMIQEQAAQIAMEMLPGLVAETINSLNAKAEPKTEDTKAETGKSGAKKSK